MIKKSTEIIALDVGKQQTVSMGSVDALPKPIIKSLSFGCRQIIDFC